MENNASQGKSGAYRAINLEYLFDLADGNFSFVEEMIEMFLSSVPPSIAELGAAIQNADWAKVRAIAHRIRPSFGFIGANSAQENLNLMEKNAIEMPDKILQEKLYREVSTQLDECLVELQMALQNKG